MTEYFSLMDSRPTEGGVADLLVKKLTPTAFLPQRGSPGAAGLDLYAIEAQVIPAFGKTKVDTGIAVACPTGTYGRIAPRSGLAMNNHIAVGAGGVDPDYRGSLGVVLFNHAPTEFKLDRGDRIAQLILEKYDPARVVEVTDLTATNRGAAGFGSTGVALNHTATPEI